MWIGQSVPGQRGFALIALLALAALISAFLIASALNLTSAGNSNEREDRNMSALRKAKAALIAYAANEQWQLYKSQETNQPGALPCPDILLDDGNADCVGAGISSTSSLVGRLPWQSMGIEDLRDASGERLWYALSYNFRKNFGTTVINSDTPGQLSVTGTAPASNVVAVLFAKQETDAFGVGNRIRKRLREPLISRKLDHAILAIQVRREILSEIVEPVLRRVEHRRKCERMPWVIVDL